MHTSRSKNLSVNLFSKIILQSSVLSVKTRNIFNISKIPFKSFYKTQSFLADCFKKRKIKNKKIVHQTFSLTFTKFHVCSRIFFYLHVWLKTEWRRAKNEVWKLIQGNSIKVFHGNSRTIKRRDKNAPIVYKF